MTTIYLIRHGEAEGNLYRRIHGWYDALITDNGFRQIAALEARFRDIPVDAVYSSDLYRTCTTARAIAEPKGLEIRKDCRFREVYLGVWEDRAFGLINLKEQATLDL
ncbi:MAG: histidine phosphatase family protein, partial [Flintibacter sp.]|uniref:histidine phosphatase family protein n=1 Tax=Flintibacter sp. TaxID=1918624 RepID=UPI00267417DA